MKQLRSKSPNKIIESGTKSMDLKQAQYQLDLEYEDGKILEIQDF